MDIPETLPLKKSQTHSFALPNISKTHAKIPSYRTTRAATTRHHSVFLDKIKDLTKDVQYQQMETGKINDQQKQLKGLLRQFNKQTHHILGRYIDRPANSESQRKPRATSTSMMQVKQKQIANSNDALEICKRQMQLLQRKCDNLKYVTVQDFQRKIESIKSQIQQLKNSNKQIIKGNTLRGLAIKKGDSKVSHEVSQIEQQKFILERKKQRLTEELKFVNEEHDKVKESHNKGDEQIKKLSEQFNKYDKQSKDSKQQKELMKIYDERKKEYALKKEKSNRKGEDNGSNNNANSSKVEPQQQPLLLEKALANLVEVKQPTKQKQQYKQKQKKQPKQLIVTVTKLPSQPPIQTTTISTKQKTQSKQSSPSQPQPPPLTTTTTTTTTSINKYQYQYLKLLKQLQQMAKRTKQQEINTKQYTVKVENSRKEMMELQEKLLAGRKGKDGSSKDNAGKNNSVVNDKNKEEAQGEKKQDKKWSFF